MCYGFHFRESLSLRSRSNIREVYAENFQSRLSMPNTGKTLQEAMQFSKKNSQLRVIVIKISRQTF